MAREELAGVEEAVVVGVEEAVVEVEVVVVGGHNSTFQ
jgi:hypothetical protein